MLSLNLNSLLVKRQIDNPSPEPVPLRHLKRRGRETILGGKNIGYFVLSCFPCFRFFDTVLHQMVINYKRSAMTCLN